jgi:hypothetical protein
MTAVAVMQPYFIPYAGYFRLLATTDLFVIYDCVQFPRRGWVHRNRLPDATGALRWLTLPLAHAPQQATIRELGFRGGAAEALAAQFSRFPLLAQSAPDAPLLDELRDVSGTPVDYIVRLLRAAASVLGLRWQTIRSSELGIASALRGQERIIAIVRALGGTSYVNAPNGRGLYDAESFARAGMSLRFLADYPGSQASILARLLGEPAAAVAAEINASCALQS